MSILIDKLSDKSFLYYVNNYGKAIYLIDDFKVGDKVIMKEFESGLFESQIYDDDIYVNGLMSSSSKRGEILEVKRIRKDSDDDGYLIMSNNFLYYPEMVAKILPI